MAHESYADSIRAQTEQLRQTPGWSQWFVALDGTRTPVYITQELNVMRVGAQAHLETAVAIKQALGDAAPTGLVYLHQDGRVDIGETLVGHWEA